MLIDEPGLRNGERLALAADCVEKGETARVWLEGNMPHEHSYFNWLVAIIKERGHTTEGAQVLACGCAFIMEPNR